MNFDLSIVPKNSEEEKNRFYELCHSLEHPINSLPSYVEILDAVSIKNVEQDALFQCLQENRPIANFNQKLSQKKLKVEFSDMLEVSTILDRLFCLFMTWLHSKGYSLADTVFTCLYMQNPEKIDNEWLKFACFVYFKIIDTIYNTAELINFSNHVKFLRHSGKVGFKNKPENVRSYNQRPFDKLHSSLYFQILRSSNF